LFTLGQFSERTGCCEAIEYAVVNDGSVRRAIDEMRSVVGEGRSCGMQHGKGKVKAGILAWAKWMNPKTRQTGEVESFKAFAGKSVVGVLSATIQHADRDEVNMETTARYTIEVDRMPYRVCAGRS